MNGSVPDDEPLLDEASAVSPVALDGVLALVVADDGLALAALEDPPDLPVPLDPLRLAAPDDEPPLVAPDDPAEPELPDDGAGLEADEGEPDAGLLLAGVGGAAFANGSTYWLSPADEPGLEASAVLGPSRPTAASTAQQKPT